MTTPNDITGSLRHDGQRHTYLLHLPPYYDAAVPLPYGSPRSGVVAYGKPRIPGPVGPGGVPTTSS
jgi:hypothetical protein